MSELYNIRLSDRDQECRRILEERYGHPWTFADILRDLLEKAVAKKPVSLTESLATNLIDESEMELRKFIAWLNDTKLMPEKTFTPSALKCWKARRKTYEANAIAEAFLNLGREPDRWQLRNNGVRPLSWWLEKDDRIEYMKVCHLKGSSGQKPLHVAG